MNFLLYIFLGVSNCPFWGALFAFFIHLSVIISKSCFFWYWVSFSFHPPVLIWSGCSVSGLSLLPFWAGFAMPWRPWAYWFRLWLCSHTVWVSSLFCLQQVYISGALLSSSNENILRHNKHKDIADLFEDLDFILIFWPGNYLSLGVNMWVCNLQRF